MTTVPELPRYVRLRRWMAGHGISDRALGEKLVGKQDGKPLTAQAVNKMLKGETMPTAHHQDCVRLGFPQDLLPHPCDLPPGRMKVEPFFPGPDAAQVGS